MTLQGKEEIARKKALALSLLFQFVTPLTSLVVTKPQEKDTQIIQKPKEKQNTNSAETYLSRAQLPAAGGFGDYGDFAQITL
ncbi:inter-alpha-trypsin inhibitor heavy chain H4-like [Hoplias malabaricus]|uniref:inter-alpha-trypsin inhibitor heavy chain H4-like n=1 Tax=Hoplias malabaricus TaxID=27720 RepID=UPI003461A3D0